MLETIRLNADCDCFKLDHLEREATSESAMMLSIRLHLGGLSLLVTISILDIFSVDRCRSTVHNWVQKVDLQSLDGVDLDHVAVDKIVIRLNDDRNWLCAAVHPTTNQLLHVRLFPTRTQVLIEMFLDELYENIS